MFRRILVAIDGSESSFHALKQACLLARAEGGAIRVISVAPPYEGELRLVGVRQHVSDMVTEPYQKALVHAVEIADSLDIPFKTIFEQGEPHERIVDTAEAEVSELIVVGVRGCNPAEKLLMGSMAARIIGYSHTDILVVPSDKEIGLESVLVAVDGSESCKRAVKQAFLLQKTYGSEIDVISVAVVPDHLYGVDPAMAHRMIEASRKNLADVAQEADSEGVEAEMLLREGEPVKIITEVAKTKHAGMILVGSHGRTQLRRLLMGSVTERVIGHAPCPILVARA